MRKRAAIVALIGVLLWCSQAAHAECSRGATCLGRWRKPQAPPPTSVEQPSTAAPVQAPSATPSPAPVPAPVTEPKRLGPRSWYGWQFLIIDGVVLATAGILDAAEVHGDGVTGLNVSLGLVFDFAAPIVHSVHHRSGIAWASLGLRTSLPLAVILSTLLVQPCSGAFDSRCLNSTAVDVSAYVGLAAASALAAALFAWEGTSSRKTSRTTLEWTPIVSPRTNGMSVGILAAF